MKQIMIGDKAGELFEQIAVDSEIPARYLLPKILIREGEAGAAALPANKLKERIALIEEVREELSREMWADDKPGSHRALYQRIWMAKKRLRSQGFSEEQIHYKVMARYGTDIEARETPGRNNNPTGRKVKIQ